MAEGKRPGGLTALAVLNFIFGGFACIGVLGLSALLTVADKITEGEATVQMPGLVWLTLLLLIVVAILLIASGVGYLGQKRFLGRTVGNAYAAVSIGQSILGVVVTSFGIGTIIGLVYPVLTLILLNTTFKDDLVN